MYICIHIYVYIYIYMYIYIYTVYVPGVVISYNSSRKVATSPFHCVDSDTPVVLKATCVDYRVR